VTHRGKVGQKLQAVGLNRRDATMDFKPLARDGPPKPSACDSEPCTTNSLPIVRARKGNT